ncbi:hypothetical protein BG004_005645 [Podila humilis]|nr:hypothetical protein BG004_005645 [Podila humilis]
MLRVRLKQEQIKRLRALPRHSLQLLGLNGNIGTNRPRRLFTQREKRQRRNKSRIAASAGSQPYTHIHYHGVKGYDPRRRLLGFQHFLNNFRDESARGQLVYKRMQQRREQEVVLKRAKQKNSARRPIVQLHKQRLDQLRLALRSGQFRRATHLAKVIFKRYSVGVNLPSAQHLLRLVKVDQTRYLRARRAYLLSDKKQSPSQLQVKQLLTTKELNVILTQCEGAKEWSHGYLISEILLRRYLSKKFTFGASPVDFGQPNSRTIHLMAGHFTESRHPERAMLMFYTLTARYPTTISLNIYESFLCRLAKLPGRFAIIEATLKHLEKHGPQPTTALYNVVLKAISWKESADRLHLLLKSMMAEGFQPNKETYMLLIAKNLSELNLQKAYQWLAELERQGFEVHVSSFEPFMKLCTEQVAKFGQQRKMVDAGKHSASQSKKDMRLTEQSQEWLNHGLRVFQTLHDRKMIPTMKIYNWLIEALLAESRVSEARKVLVSMMDVHLYTPTQRTWSLFFNHYLSKGDYVEANRILSKMRQHPNPVIESSTSLQGKKPFGPIYPEAPVPTKMYRTLFRHVLDNWSVSFAERNVYEMMVHQDRSVRPTEKQVQDLIWKLGPHPEAAERVYVLLYPQTQSKSRSYGHARGDDSNRIVTLGPIQMSQVGVMNAKSRTSVPAQHEDVWRAWRVMTQFYQKATSNTTNNHVPTTGPNSRKSVLSCAFEQVARASRKLTTQEQQKEQARIEQAERLLQKPSVDGWDFGPARRGPSVGPASVGLGLRFGLVGAGTGVGAGHGQHLTDHLQIKGKNRHLIQQMLKRPDFLQPLLDQQNAATSNSERRTPDAARVDDSDTRLQNLLSSYEWMRNHEVPIQPSAMHMFLESLISHGDFKSVRETLDQMSSSRIDKRTIDLVAKYREEF